MHDTVRVTGEDHGMERGMPGMDCDLTLRCVLFMASVFKYGSHICGRLRTTIYMTVHVPSLSTMPLHDVMSYTVTPPSSPDTERQLEQPENY